MTMNSTRTTQCAFAFFLVLGLSVGGLSSAAHAGTLSSPEAVRLADLFGPSDEEKAAAAAAAQHEQAQDSSIANLTERVNELEDSLRRLTGQIEVLNHRLDELDQRIEQIRKDFDYKLCALSAQQLGATTGEGSPDAIPCPGSASQAQPPVPPSQSVQTPSSGPSGQPAQLAPGPGILGTLPENPPGSPPQTQTQTAAPAQTASLDPHAQFDAAMNLLARAEYDEARAAFQNFADANPKDPLVPQALYWVGDIAYVQKDYPAAARTFAEELKKYPSGPRAAESMLKLGQSLLALDQKQEGCATLRALPGRYPGASKTVLSQAEGVRKAGGCRP